MKNRIPEPEPSSLSHGSCHKGFVSRCSNCLPNPSHCGLANGHCRWSSYFFSEKNLRIWQILTLSCWLFETKGGLEEFVSQQKRHNRHRKLPLFSTNLKGFDPTSRNRWSIPLWWLCLPRVSMANQVPKLGWATRNGFISLRAKSLRAKTLSGLISEMKLCKVLQHKSCIRKIPQKHLFIFWCGLFFCRILTNWMVGLAYFDSHFQVAPPPQKQRFCFAGLIILKETKSV